MRAGIAKIDITPQPAVGVFMTGYTNIHDKPSRDVHDPLFARILLLDDGQTRIALVALDLIAGALALFLQGGCGDLDPYAGAGEAMVEEALGVLRTATI